MEVSLAQPIAYQLTIVSLYRKENLILCMNRNIYLPGELFILGDGESACVAVGVSVCVGETVGFNPLLALSKEVGICCCTHPEELLQEQFLTPIYI